MNPNIVSTSDGARRDHSVVIKNVEMAAVVVLDLFQLSKPSKVLRASSGANALDTQLVTSWVPPPASRLSLSLPLLFRLSL